MIVHKVDRLARNRVDDVEITLALKAAGAALVAKYAKNRGWFQCVMPGAMIRSKSPMIAPNGSPAVVEKAAN